MEAKERIWSIDDEYWIEHEDFCPVLCDGDYEFENYLDAGDCVCKAKKEWEEKTGRKSGEYLRKAWVEVLKTKDTTKNYIYNNTKNTGAPQQRRSRNERTDDR